MVAVHRHKPSRDDALRVRRAQAGDPAAFDELIDAHRDLLERVVRHFVRNGSDVEDVTQEAWIRAATHIRDLREPDRFRPWLRTIARNSCMTFLKRQRHDRGVATLDNDEAPQIADPDEGTPEAHVLSRDEQRKVWETLGALSERDRMALFYREYQGLPYPEIAERLSISRNAAEVCVFRARERFRRLYYRVESDEARCEFSGLQLSMYMDGDLDELTQRRVMKHLETCDGCAQRIASMHAGRDVYRQMAGLVGLPGGAGGLFAALHELVAHVTSWIGGGGGSTGGGAAAAGGSIAGTAAAASGTAGASSAVAAATGGTAASLSATLAGPIASSVIIGAIVVQGVAPAASVEEAMTEPAPAVTVASSAPDEAMLLAWTEAPGGEEDASAGTASLAAADVSLEFLEELIAAGATADDEAEAETSARDEAGPPAHAAAQAPWGTTRGNGATVSSSPHGDADGGPSGGDSPGASGKTPTGNSGGSAAGAGGAGGGNPPEHAAAHGQQNGGGGPGNGSGNGPPAHAASGARNAPGQQAGPGGAPDHAGPSSSTAVPGRGHGGPPAHAAARGVERGVQAATINDAGRDSSASGSSKAQSGSAPGGPPAGDAGNGSSGGSASASGANASSSSGAEGLPAGGNGNVGTSGNSPSNPGNGGGPPAHSSGGGNAGNAGNGGGPPAHASGGGNGKGPGGPKG